MSICGSKLNIDYEKISDIVLDNRANWIDRGFCHTFGAAAYLDKGNFYRKRVALNNNILSKNFSDIYEFLCDHFDASTHKSIALPGFHIFTDAFNGIKEESIHEDLSYMNLPIYNKTAKNGRSFTICLRKPDCGAGLNYWDENNVKHYQEYEVGYMYTHDAGMYHQIANPGFVEKNEYRITMQGHLIDINNKTYIYF